MKAWAASTGTWSRSFSWPRRKPPFALKQKQRVRNYSRRYRDIRAGLGFKKTPAVYGAFPTDPYSHTPKGRGAQQPGMTGMVKETILARQAELGWTVMDGRLVFNPWLLDPQELLAAPATFFYLDVSGKPQQIDLHPGSLAFTICGTPVVILRGGPSDIRIHYSDGSDKKIDDLVLDEGDSRHIFLRDGHITTLRITIGNKDNPR